MFRNTLFVKLFFFLFVVVVALIPSIYYFTTPLVDQHFYAIEERSGKTTLDTIYTLLKQTQQDLASLENYALESHKRKLRDIVAIASVSLDRIYAKYQQGELTYDEAKKEAIETISCFRYDNNDYLYVCDYDANFIYHPDAELNGTNGSQLKDLNGRLIVVPMISGARSSSESYHDYWWNRLGAQSPIHKLTYSKNLPLWKWVIGSGVYLEDVKHETDLRKKELIASLREFVRSAKVATSGYLYIFDGDLNMIIHPNSNIEKTNFATMLNPLTGKSIGQELMDVAHNTDNHLLYTWDKPSDPGNYSYDKVAWVRYFAEYDYYIASSVYVDDLKSSGTVLATRLFQITLGAILLFALCGVALIYNVTSAIKRLALVADRIVGGDLTVKARVYRKDEIGQLGSSFNLMVDKLKEQIDTLEQRVVTRTTEQNVLVAALEQSNIETNMLKNANEMLGECRNPEEVFQAVRIIMLKAFPESSGSLFSLGYEGQRLEVVVDWNSSPSQVGRVYEYDACFAIRRGSSYVYDGDDSQLPCPHIGENFSRVSVCVPISAYGDTFGILNLGCGSIANKDMQRSHGLVEDIAAYTASALANLRLRIRLHQQSIRDPLTGLYNRRYMDASLRQEENRARRNGTQVGIVMLDVDHFKRFNDTYGHEAGDEILRVLGKILRDHFRESDIVCRYGGEEFIVILPEIGTEQCRTKAEQLRGLVENNAYIFSDNEKLAITISLGVALFPLHGEEIRSVVKSADDALYQAKDKGRNVVEYA